MQFNKSFCKKLLIQNDVQNNSLNIHFKLIRGVIEKLCSGRDKHIHNPILKVRRS